MENKFNRRNTGYIHIAYDRVQYQAITKSYIFTSENDVAIGINVFHIEELNLLELRDLQFSGPDIVYIL